MKQRRTHIQSPQQKEFGDRLMIFIDRFTILDRVMRKSWKKCYGGKNLDLYKHKDFILSIQYFHKPQLHKLAKAMIQAKDVFVHNSKI